MHVRGRTRATPTLREGCLENLVIDAADPRRLGRFRAHALGAELTYESGDLVEARLTVPGGPWLDLCFPKVGGAATSGPRLHLDRLGGRERDAVVERLVSLGARHLETGQHDAPRVVAAELEGIAFCVMGERATYTGTGPVAALLLDSTDSQRNGDFGAAMTGWVPAEGHAEWPSGLPSSSSASLPGQSRQPVIMG